MVSEAKNVTDYLNEVPEKKEKSSATDPKALQRNSDRL
jgi:hypothetical protein